MKTPVPPYVEGVCALAAEARERAADALLGLDAVRQAVTTAAASGFDQVVIRPALPVDLRGTAAARAAVKFLTDGGASATWQKYVAADPDGRQLVGHELRIEWGGAPF